MFETLIPKNATGRGRKRAIFLVSAALHAATIAGIVVAPLLRADAHLPSYAILDAALVSPPVLPGIPPAGRPGGEEAKPGDPDRDRPKASPRPEATFVVPDEISMSTDEDLSLDLPGPGEGTGVDGGIDLTGGGNTDWEIGREYVPEAVGIDRRPVVTVSPPRLVRKVNPDYPATAIASRVSGPVVVEAVTDAYGRVREARVVSGHALLRAAALEAVREWRYEPYLVNGVPRPVSFTVTVIFSLESR